MNCGCFFTQSIQEICSAVQFRRENLQEVEIGQLAQTLSTYLDYQDFSGFWN